MEHTNADGSTEALYSEYFQKLTPEILLKNGWELKNKVYVIRDNVRLGWYPDGTTIVGYHEFPAKITTVLQMQVLQSLLGNKHLINTDIQ